MLARVDKDRLSAFRKKIDLYRIVEERESCEESLSEFLTYAWPYIDSSDYQSCWAIDAMADHLEAVISGYIPRLLINCPPRCSKTTLVSIAFPAWVWARSDISYLSGPQVQFLCASYGHTLSLDSSNKCRRLISSSWYQERWGSRFRLRDDQNTKFHWENDKGGARIATSVGGSLIGLGGAINIGDDLNNTEQVESDAERETVKNFWQEFHSLRLNDPKQSAVIAIQQRLHEYDVSGLILESGEGWTHLCYDSDTEVLTRKGWIKFPDLKRGVEVMAVNPDDLKAEWQTPTSYVTRPYRGEMIHYKSMTADLLVTPDHRMVYGDPNDCYNGTCTRWRVKPALELPQSFHLPQVIDWIGCEGPIKFGGRDWEPDVLAQFMGWYLAEGCSYNRRHMVTIVQSKKSSYIDDIDKTLQKVPFHHFKSSHSEKMWAWCIRDKQLAIALSRLGKSKERRIPHCVKQMAPEALRIFLIAYTKGDGSFWRQHWQSCNRQRMIIYTTSSKMGDDLQECATKAGWASSLNQYVYKAGDGFAKQDGIKYVLTIRLSRNNYHKTSATLRPWHISKEVNNGLVYCLSVPSTAILVRRNGRVAVSGNCIPMRYEANRTYHTIVLPQYDSEEPWDDPRTREGELMWPERFGEPEVIRLENVLGPYMAAGRLQQRPAPKGGGILQRDWWRPWDSIEAARYGLEWKVNRREYPQFELVIGSLDTAYGEKEENDFNALTIWGMFLDLTSTRRTMLAYAWNKRLPLNGRVLEQKQGEANVSFQERQKEAWGLTEWVADTCKRYKVQRLLIENKARGVDVANELQRLYARNSWGIQMANPVRDKVARAHSVVPLFTDGSIYAPTDRQWCAAVVDQCAIFNKGEHDDLVDSAVQALLFMRQTGLLLRADEQEAEVNDSIRFYNQEESVRDRYGI